MKKAPKLLLVDDEKDLLEVLHYELTEAGFNTFKAGDGDEAYNICIQEDVDLIVTDINMPKFGGFALLKKLQLLRKRHIPVIFITAYASHNAEEFSNFGNVDVLSKPFEAQILIEKVKSILENMDKSEEDTDLKGPATKFQVWF